MLLETLIERNYSDLQTQRFSENEGSSLMEITFLTQIPVILNYLAVGCTFALRSVVKDFRLLFVFEFLCIVFLLILFLTLATHLLLFFYIACVFVVLVVFVQEDRRRVWSLLQNEIIVETKLPCITVFRAVVNVFTVICILAADFTCFPSRFLKTESYGYGLMDTGVGLFVIIYSFSDSPYRSRSFRYSSYKILPFFVLGLGRYICTKILSYQHQVSEYGTQWNFFITLSVVTLFNEIFLKYIRSYFEIFILSLIFLVIHESSLVVGLQQWILSDASREDFISANREGLFSLIGFEVLYLSGMMIRQFLPKKNDLIRRYVSILPLYLLGFLVCTTLTKLAEFSIGISRRTVNSGYIFWILSLSFLTFINIIISDIVLRICIYNKANYADSTSQIMKAINYNGLLFFLLGNVLTGFINLSTKTLLIGNISGVIIISVYMFVCCAFVVFLHRSNIRLR